MVCLLRRGDDLVEIRMRDLGHDYDGRTVFRSINLAFDGDALAVTGPNGSGKSTLLRIVAGLLTPSSGSVETLIDGAPVTRPDLRRAAGMAAPDLPLYYELSVRENLSFMLAARSGRVDRSSVDDALSRLGLQDRADDLFGELSSGLRRRACVAAAIAHSPLLLLLDEPYSNLDAEGVRALDAVIEAQRARGMVVIATNDPEDAGIASAAIDLGAKP